MVAGHHRPEIESWITRLPGKALAVALGILVAATVTLYIVQVLTVDALRANPELYALAFNKANVPIGRLIGFALFGGTAFALLTLAWKPIQAATGWLLLPLGENCLTAYALHIFVVAVVTKATPVLFGGALTAATATIFQLATVLAVWAVVKYEPAVRAQVLRLVATLAREDESYRPNIAAERFTLAA